MLTIRHVLTHTQTHTLCMLCQLHLHRGRRGPWLWSRHTLMVHSARMVHTTPNIFSVPKMQNRRPYRTSRTCRDSQSRGMCVCARLSKTCYRNEKTQRAMCWNTRAEQEKKKNWQRGCFKHGDLSKFSYFTYRGLLRLNLNHSSHQSLNVFSQPQEICSVFQYTCEWIRAPALAKSLVRVSI